jgi:glycosyltransferase involved in cell wall biosynthesis
MNCKVLLDLTATKSIHNGLGQFSIHLGNAVLKAKPSWMDIDILIPEGKADLFPIGTKVRYRHRLMEDWVPSLVQCAISKRYSYDVWHVTNQDSRFWPLDQTVPTVFTLHDLNFLREKKDKNKIQRRVKRLQRRVKRATTLVTASEFARGEICDTLVLNISQAVLIYHGVAPVLSAEAVPDIEGVTRPFLFSIGELLPKKNLKVLLPFLANLKDYTLAIAGKFQTTYGEEFCRLIAEHGLTDRVVMLGSVSDEQRSWLYQHCEAFLFPSISEGFGLPVLEAMSYGKPVFCSRLTSLPEVGGDRAFYWDTFSAEHMVDVFSQGMKQAEDEQFSARQLKHAQSFSWDRAAEAYIDLYKSLWHGK